MVTFLDKYCKGTCWANAGGKVLSSTDENSFDHDNVGMVPCLWANFAEKMYRSSLKLKKSLLLHLSFSTSHLLLRAHFITALKLNLCTAVTAKMQQKIIVLTDMHNTKLHINQRHFNWNTSNILTYSCATTGKATAVCVRPQHYLH
jgi:hypothetical protein